MSDKWILTGEGEHEQLINLDQLFAYVRAPDGSTIAISNGGAAVPMPSDKFDHVKEAMLAEEDDDDATG
jgi:hypothetical protein